MTDHVHAFTRLFPSDYESDDLRKRCECGARAKPAQPILAIDPGSTESAWLIYAEGTVRTFGKSPNVELLELLKILRVQEPLTVVIEKVEGYGMPVGVEVFETVYWSGRFAEAAYPLPVERIGRKEVKRRLCGTTTAKDPNVRQALLDRYGGKDTAIGTKAAPGPLRGVVGDIWSALGVAVAWTEQQEEA